MLLSLAESSDVPIICPDSVRRLLSEAAAEESLLQRQPTAAAATAGLDGDVQLDDISLASLPLRHREAYSRLASRLAECCSAWGCSAAAVHCCGAAARLLGRAVAERIPPKPKGASIAAAAAAGEQREREVLLLIVDRLQDLQSPLAPGSLLSPSAPSDGGEWTLQQLKVLQQHKQRQEQPQQPQLVDPSAVPSQLIDSTGVRRPYTVTWDPLRPYCNSKGLFKNLQEQ
ncbi:hypothetical protein ETH_00026850 [Eimeria tenella]|uniref:Uncharacterized protein n=1 Tax=Eimeria tenella TaxID=5802 RepID=U6KQH3_EIMTE|nr:hypothetical protein ETH_00026850 [Eimeria tenella]CDJ37688.1 hypothetical protein ETH_00026850 [Eimeria tenella]|eukprot:XP_013228526.1 hypothetical protein ETH_00026850 [Eimeria tenella]